MVPAGVLSFGSFLIYNHSHKYLYFSVIVTVFGIFLGFKLAEHIRKKYGLDTFFGKLLSTPELEEKGNEESTGR
jgi:NO-binding membrane sensor protein with MHYT domain